MDKRTKILIIDDEESLSEMLKEYFIRQGYEVDTAYDGEEGLFKAKKFKPDLILLDILMPVLDGVSALKQIKKDPVTAGTPVIMLTNFDAKDKLNEVRAAGTPYYLMKVNCSPKDLDKKIKQVLNLVE